MLDFSQRLKQLRRDRHLTQAQVAKRIGVTAAMVSSYETDIRLPSYEVMVRLADLFGVTVDYLLCRTDERLTAKEYKEKDSYELSEFMSAHTITVGGVVVSDADKRRIGDMATGLFWTRITATEKKN